MTVDQQDLLRPHAQHFADMAAFVVTRDKNELDALKNACAAASMTNCAWDIYRAAKYLAVEIECELHQRLKKRASAAQRKGNL